MSSCKKQEAGGRRQSAGERRQGRSLACFLLSASCLLMFAGCRQDMQNQPKYRPYRSSDFFRDGLSGRPLVEGTVPRGYLRDYRPFYFGKKSASDVPPWKVPEVALLGGGPIELPTTPGASSINTAAMYPDDIDTIPYPIDKEALDRGQERYQIFCSVCHGMTGYGDGMVARRGFNKPAPASFHQDKLRQAPVGHFFDVITNGWGAMPSYAAQVSPQDRWAIIAYIRALQLSQMPAGSNAPVSEQGNSSRSSKGVNNQTTVTHK